MNSLIASRASEPRHDDEDEPDLEDGPEPDAADHAQYLTFMLGGEVYAIGILAVKEIIEYGELTEVPMMPDCIRGVINLRGAVVPVLDLAARFGKGTTAPGKRTCIVIVEHQAEGGRQVSGMVVDAVNAVLDMAAGQIEPAPAFGARIRTDFIDGMGKINGKFVVVLNVERVLSMRAAQEPEAGAPAGPPA